MFFNAAAFFLSFADLPSDLSVALAGETRRAPGGGHPDDEYIRVEAEVTHQACVPPPVQRLSAAVQEEGVSDQHPYEETESYNIALIDDSLDAAGTFYSMC